MNIPLYESRQFTEEEAVQAVCAAMRNGARFSGNKCRELEEKVCEITGSAQAVAAGSAESALLNILYSWSVGKGEAVFVPSFADPYVVLSVMQCGAVPVFVDCHRDTWTMNPEKLENAVKKCIKSNELYPRAVIVSDTFGMPFDVDAINSVCTRYGLLLIEDTLMALGAEYGGRKAGTFGDAAVIGFTTSMGISALCNGGAALTNDPQLAKNLRLSVSGGVKITDTSTEAAETVRRAAGAPMDEVTARLIAPQLERIKGKTALRTLAAKRFAEAAGSTAVKCRKMNVGEIGAHPVFPLCAKDQESAAEMVRAFRTAGIECRAVFSKPLCRQPAFKELGVPSSEMPVGSNLSVSTFMLPCHEELTEEQIGYICHAIKKICI